MPHDRTGGETQVSAVLRPKLGSHRSERRIEDWSRAQHGIVTLGQLRELGLSARAVGHRVTAGRLHRVHRGVFAVERPTRAGHWMAAVLAGGPGAALSHRSAAELWGLADTGAGPVDVTVRGTARRRPGIEVHSAALADRDLSVRDRIPCTALPRTLLDLAATSDRRVVERAIDRAEELRVFDLEEVTELLTRSRGQRGARGLATALAAYAGPIVTRSEAEERFLALVNEAGLPTPEVNAWIPLPAGGGYSPDFLWRAHRLIVEVDGRAHHARRRAFEHDRERDRRLALAGFETRRYAAAEVLGNPLRVALEIERFLAPSAGPQAC